MSYGFLGVRISKDRVENWIFLSNSSGHSASVIEKMNSKCILDLDEASDFYFQASEIQSRSDNLVQKLTELRNGFIQKLSPSYKEGDEFFKGMDNHFAGKRLLIDNSLTDQILIETAEYESWLISLLSDENEQVKQKITELLNANNSGQKPDLNTKKNYLFRDFPAITDISVINTMILNVRIAEYQTLKYMGGKTLPKH
jgi:hypothetical protein